MNQRWVKTLWSVLYLYQCHRRKTCRIRRFRGPPLRSGFRYDRDTEKTKAAPIVRSRNRGN